MNMLQRFIRNVTQRIRKTYYEGPDPPNRIRAMVNDFANAHPQATRQDWVEFSSSLAEEFYRSAYTRGLEWSERDLERREPLTDPALLAEAEGNDYDWGKVGIVYDNSDIVDDDEPKSPSDIERQEEQYRELYFKERLGVKSK